MRQALRLFGGMDQNQSKPMGFKNPIGGYSLLLQSASSHFSRLSGILPESGAVKEMEMKGAIEVVRTPSPGFYSRLFLVPKARGTWRPIIDLSVLNTHIQCPSFKMETNGSLLNGSIHPSFRQYLRFCHEGVVWQIRALPFGLNTAPRVFTMVTAPVVTYAHLNGVSLRVYLDDWLIKTHIGRVSQTANPMVIGPLHTPRLGGKCGEVKPDSFTCGLLLGNFARYQSRPRLPLREEDRTMALHLGGFPSGAGPACPALVTTFGAPSFPREASSLRPVAYPTHSVPTSLRMVSNQRSSSDPGQPGSRDPGFHSLVENSFESPQRNPTRIPSGRSFHLHSAVGWGAHMDKRTASGRWSEAMKELHINVLELNAIWLGLQAFEDTLHDSNVRQCLCHCQSEKSGGHSVSTDVPHGYRYLRMGRRTVHDTDTQTSPWASQCVSRSSEPQRSDSENRMESESSRSTACIPSLGQSTCGSVCTQVQHQTSNLHVSDF